MLLTSLSLFHVRNHEEKELLLSPKTTVVVGENARGKTNILESIHLLLNGEGFRETSEEELLMFGADRGFVRASLSDGEEHERTIEVLLTRQGDIVHKTFFLEKTQKVGYVYKQHVPPVVLFFPEDIILASGPTDERRSYIDRVLERFDKEFKSHRKNYGEALRKRNKLLETIYDERKLREELAFWDTYLEKEGALVQKGREEYIAFLNTEPQLEGRVFAIQYEQNRFTKERADEVLGLDMRTKRTSLGPQKDELIITLDSLPVRNFGSRSQQRLAVLWLKLRELAWARQQSAFAPILLLDDITSEFDEKNKHIIGHLLGAYQTIVTTTERDFTTKLVGEHTVIEV